VTGPLIVQSDRTVLLETAHPLAADCRMVLARFAELERSPEHFHTYRITPLSLWNARAAGMAAEEMVDALSRFSRYPVPQPVTAEIVEQAARYGRLRLEREDGRLQLRCEDTALLEEVLRAEAVDRLVGGRLGPDACEVSNHARGRLKLALIKLGWPVEDLAGYMQGTPLELELRGVDLRDYQVAAADAFWAGGGIGGGSGVLVLPCGAGKTVIGLAAMARARTSTLILVTSIVAAHQWASELVRFTNLDPDQVGEYSGEWKSIRPVTIATYQVMTTRKGDEFPHLSLFSREDWGLVVYDEVHLLPAPVFRMTAEIQSKRRLGLTATLVREDGREEDVFSLIGPKRYDAPWLELEEQGWIAQAWCREVRTALPAELRMVYAMAEGKDRYRIAATNPRKLGLVSSLCRRHAGDRVLVIGQYLPTSTRWSPARPGIRSSRCTASSSWPSRATGTRSWTSRRCSATR
jgi:DNA excision repair protein ERCC-3